MSIEFFIFLYYIYFGRYIKPYYLLVSPPFDVLIGISYDPPLTDPFKFIQHLLWIPRLKMLDLLIN